MPVLPPQWWVESDWNCLHGNGVSDTQLAADVAMARSLTSGPLCINEDDHQNITQSRYDMLNQLGVGNGLYYQNAIQNVPSTWKVDSRPGVLAYLNKVKAATGGAPVP